METREQKDRRNKRARERRAEARRERDPVYCFNCGNEITYNPESKGKQRTKFCSEGCYEVGRKKDPTFYEKKREYSKEYVARNKERISEARKSYWTNPRTQYLSRVSNLKTRYGVTEEEYVGAMDAQKGCCAICGDSLERPYVDHCHTTGCFRGLLCQFCNTAIGHLKEDASIMRSAADYVEKSYSLVQGTTVQKYADAICNLVP